MIYAKDSVAVVGLVEIYWQHWMLNVLIIGENRFRAEWHLTKLEIPIQPL